LLLLLLLLLLLVLRKGTIPPKYFQQLRDAMRASRAPLQSYNNALPEHHSRKWVRQTQ
jgi:hypothetical protein